MPNYFVTESSRTLHIEGLCHFTRNRPDKYTSFKTEEEARTCYQGNVKHCKTCWKNRDSENPRRY